MKIKWLGHSTFLIESNNTVLITDPHNPMFGDLPPNIFANAVTVSHTHADHNYTKILVGSPKIINRVGSFVVDGFNIKGIATFHDNQGGAKRGSNIAYIYESENIKLCHLGDLGHILTKKQLKEIGDVDILMIPVGGFYTINLNEVTQIVNQINPRIVLPMHYKSTNSSITLPLVGVDQFISALDWNTKEVNELKIDKSITDSLNHLIVLFK